MLRKIAAGLLTMTLLSFAPLQARACTEVQGEVMQEKVLTPQETEQITRRLYEIRELTKTNLNEQEKKVLREEVLQIKGHLENHPVVIYMSGGLLILIIILLILL